MEAYFIKLRKYDMNKEKSITEVEKRKLPLRREITAASRTFTNGVNNLQKECRNELRISDL